MFSKKATKIDEIFTVDLTLTTYRQINGEDFVKFCGLLRKHKLYTVGLTLEVSRAHGRAVMKQQFTDDHFR